MKPSLFANGMVGLVYALRLARLRRRIQRTSTLMDMERQVHREHLLALQNEMKELLFAQTALVQAAAEYQAALERKRAGLPSIDLGGPPQ